MISNIPHLRTLKNISLESHEFQRSVNTSQELMNNSEFYIVIIIVASIVVIIFLQQYCHGPQSCCCKNVVTILCLSEIKQNA